MVDELGRRKVDDYHHVHFVATLSLLLESSWSVDSSAYCRLNDAHIICAAL